MHKVGMALVTLLSWSVAACSDNGSNGNTGGTSNAGATSGGTTAGGGGAATAGGGAASTGGAVAAATGGTGGSSGTATVGCAIPMGTDEPPAMLSQTGCVDMADPSKPVNGFIPYTVRSPLWSDGAEKHRFMRVPVGSKIKVLDCSTQTADCTADTVNGDDGHWEVPIGTVLIKNFSLESKIIETRLVMRRSMSKWLFYSYEWNEGATEATLLPDDEKGKDRTVGAQTWHYPGRAQCPQCHTPGGGFALGPSTPQFNVDYPYAEGAMNQLEKFKQLDLFETPPKAMDGYPSPSDQNVALEQRALSYIQANCAICHRPSGEYSGMDMRWTRSHEQTPIEAMRLCDVVERDMEKTGMPKYRVVPGQPTMSAMSFRVHALDEVRMPKIGSLVVDPLGVKLIDDWISAMPNNACPGQTPQ